MLLCTMVWATSKSEAEYAKGILAYGKGKYAKARDHFRATVDLEPDNPHAQLYLGLSLRRLGAFREAVAAMRKAQQLDPSLLYIHYHLGVALYKLERYAQVQKAFEAFLAAAPDAPEARHVRHNLDVINKRQRERRVVHLQGAIAFEYDDNVILEPNDPDGLGQGVGKGDGRAVFSLVARALPVQTESWRLGAEYGLYQSLHFDLTQFNVQQHTGRLFARYVRKPLTLRLAADYTYTTLDNSRFSEAVTVLPSLTIQSTERLLSVLSLRYRNHNYHNQILGSNEAFRDRDGWTARPGIDQYLLFGGQRSYARFSYYFEASRNDGSDWEYNSHLVNLGLHLLLKWGITLGLNGTYVRYDYLHDHFLSPDSFFDSTGRLVNGEERLDDRFIGSIKLQRKLGRHLFFSDLIPAVAFKHTSNFSNIDIFEYRRNIVTLMFTGRFYSPPYTFFC